MIASVTFAKTTYADLPNKFEAGTPDIAGAVGLGAALDYVDLVGLDNIRVHEDRLLRYASENLRQIPGVRIIGTAANKTGVLSFIVENPPLSALDVGTKLDLAGVEVRTGHHCCQPVMDRYGIPGTARASFAMYNSIEEIDSFVAALGKIVAEAAKARPAAPVKAEPNYPKAYAASPGAAADKIAAAFEFLDNWPERYQQIIDIGKRLPPMPLEMKTVPNRVLGCQSTVFMHAQKKPGTSDVVEFLADSDADIVRGELALLQRLYSGQRAGAVLGFDFPSFMQRIGLDKNLTQGRRNGMAEMVKRVQRFAEDIAGTK